MAARNVPTKEYSSEKQIKLLTLLLLNTKTDKGIYARYGCWPAIISATARMEMQPRRLAVRI